MKNTKKIIFVIIAIAYFLLPGDLIPDFIVGLGQIDDLIMFAMAAVTFLQKAPAKVEAQKNTVENIEG